MDGPQQQERRRFLEAIFDAAFSAHESRRSAYAVATFTNLNSETGASRFGHKNEALPTSIAGQQQRSRHMNLAAPARWDERGRIELCHDGRPHEAITRAEAGAVEHRYLARAGCEVHLTHDVRCDAG